MNKFQVGDIIAHTAELDYSPLLSMLHCAEVKEANGNIYRIRNLTKSTSNVLSCSYVENNYVKLPEIYLIMQGLK